MPVTGDRPELNLKAVVYATDFSLRSRNAGLYAAQLASYFVSKTAGRLMPSRWNKPLWKLKSATLA